MAKTDKKETKKTNEKKNNESKSVAEQVNKELAALTKAHHAFVIKLLGVAGTMRTAATLHGMHAALMEREMNLLTQVVEEGSKKESKGKGKKNA